MYQFNHKFAEHMFCPKCGVEITVGLGKGRAINVRTVDGLSLEALKIKHFDGGNLTGWA